MSTQIVLEGDLETEAYERVERILMLQLGTVVGRFASLKAIVSEHKDDGVAPFQCRLIGILKQGERLEVAMVNRGIHVCVADAAARLLREVRRHHNQGLRSQYEKDLRTGY